MPVSFVTLFQLLKAASGLISEAQPLPDAPTFTEDEFNAWWQRLHPGEAAVLLRSVIAASPVVAACPCPGPCPPDVAEAAARDILDALQVAGNDPEVVGKLGDGTLLKLLIEYAPQIIQLITVILPLFVSPNPKPAA